MILISWPPHPFDHSVCKILYMVSPKGDKRSPPFLSVVSTAFHIPFQFFVLAGFPKFKNRMEVWQEYGRNEELLRESALARLTVNL